MPSSLHMSEKYSEAGPNISRDLSDKFMNIIKISIIVIHHLFSVGLQ